MTSKRLILILLFSAGLAVSAPAETGVAWPQWGGPDRDFAVPARELSRNWGENGPPVLWSRPLGGGFARQGDVP